MKLQILVPQYKETDDIIKPLLDSIALQQNINMNEVGVIIANDGSDVKLTDEFLHSYPYEIQYIQCEHNGVSATRQAALDAATADYVMFCDADDMFYNMCGLWIIFREMDAQEMRDVTDKNGNITKVPYGSKGFDSLMSAFVEETRNPETKEVLYINHDQDSTFVHGKVHRLKYLKNNNIKWNPKLTIHEDNYFNILCQKLSKFVKYCPTPFYLWRWRDESVCRHDPKYILKTFNNMLESNTALIHEFQDRNMNEEAGFYCVAMVFDSYYSLNKKEWLEQENQDYRHAVELRFKKYYEEFEELFNSISEEKRNQIIVGMRNRMFQEGMFIESITFNDWIGQIKNLKE